MIYRGPGFLAVVWFIPPPLPSANCLSFSVFLCLAGRAYYRERGGGGERGAKSYNRKKAWPCINHSILSVRGFKRELLVRSVVLNGMFVSATWTRAPPPLSPCPAFPASLSYQPSRYERLTICVTESRGAKMKLPPGAGAEIANCGSGARAEITNFGSRSLLFTTALRNFIDKNRWSFCK